MRKFLPFVLSCFLLFPLFSTGCSSAAARDEYVLTLEYFPEEEKLGGTMSVTVSNRGENALKELSFHLWANAYREGATYRPVSELYAPVAYYAGESYGGITIASVSGGESFTVGGEDENNLIVRLSSPLYPKESVTLTMAYEVLLAKINHRLGVGENTVNLTHFYPALCPYTSQGCTHVYSPYGDPFVSDCADFDVTLTVPEGYTAVFGGRGKCTAAEGKKTYRVQTEGMRDTAFVLGNFASKSDQVGGTQVEYFYFSDATPDDTLKVATESFAYYTKTFGKSGLDRYVVVQADFPYGGMEYAGLSLISSTLRKSEVAAVVAHETAHQWWYSLVGSDPYECAWQDEGLAEFSTALFFGAHPAYGRTFEEAVASSEKSYRAYFSVYSQIYKTADTSMNRPLTSYSGEYEYRNIAYDKGVILFARLKNLVGDGKFFSSLKRYVKSYAGRIATPYELAASFSDVHAEGMIESFTSGKCVI